MAAEASIARRRLRNQHLTGPAFEAPADAVRWLGAVQAQDFAGAAWGLGQRVGDCSEADVAHAYARGEVLRAHAMRPTWHLIARDDIRWIQELTAPRVHAGVQSYYRRLEIDKPTVSRANDALRRALRGGHHLTRVEVARVFADAGIVARGQRLALLLMHAELDGLICSGERRSKQHTYALLDERAPRARTMRRDEALVELTRRYFTSHGPALARDFAWWSGLSAADVRAGIDAASGDLERDVIAGQAYWCGRNEPRPAGSAAPVHLLPNYDEALVAYKDHGPSLHPALPDDRALLDRVLARHIVTVGGRVVGGWRNADDGGQLVVEVQLLAPLAATHDRALQSAARRYGRFLGSPVSLVVRR